MRFSDDFRLIVVIVHDSLVFLQRFGIASHVEIAVRDFQPGLHDELAFGKPLDQELKRADRLVVIVIAEKRPAEVKLRVAGKTMAGILLNHIAEIAPRLLEFFQFVGGDSRVIEDVLRHRMLWIAVADVFIPLNRGREIFEIQRRVASQQKDFRGQAFAGNLLGALQHLLPLFPGV